MIDKKLLMQQAYCSKEETLQLTSDCCHAAIEEGIVGDFAEAGVAMGVHPLLMHEYPRRVHLFDSFEGIPIHGENDIEWAQVYGVAESNQRLSSGVTSCSLADVKALLTQYGNMENYVFHVGWFADTFKKLTDEKFSVLRLDCDLYESYKLCFEYLYPRLSKGGYLIIDDHTLSGCIKAVKEFIPNKNLIIRGDAAWIKK